MAKGEWTLNASYQALLDKSVSIVKEDACMKFYDEIKPPDSETDVPGVELRAGLLQSR